MTDNEYAVTEEDLKGGGNRSAKPRGKYTGEISKAVAKKDKKGKAYIGFGLKILHGKFKNGLLFENYLPLARDVNAYQAARRNSLHKAVGLKAGELPYGAPVPGAPDVEALNGTVVDVTVEHEFENVPGEEYSLTTSKSAKSAWVTGGWESGLDDKGRLVRSPGGTPYDAPIEPREVLTFYDMSDDFEGVGGAADDSADEDWG